MSNVLDLSWIDVYKDVQEGYISWGEFRDYLMNLEEKSYNEGFEDGYKGEYNEKLV